LFQGTEGSTSDEQEGLDADIHIMNKEEYACLSFIISQRMSSSITDAEA
jgi:hypothetical protein